MKLIPFFLVVLITNLQAQNDSIQEAEFPKYSVGISSFQAINFRTLSTTNNNGETRAIRNRLDRKSYRTSYGVSFSKAYNKIISVSSGILYSRIGFQTKWTSIYPGNINPMSHCYEDQERAFYFDDPSTSINCGFAFVDYIHNSDYRYVFYTQNSPMKEREVKLVFNYDYIEIPIDVTFSMPRNWKNVLPYYKSGLSVGYLLEQRTEGYIRRNEQNEKVVTRLIANKTPEIENSYYRYYNFSFRNAIGLSCLIHPKLNLKAEYGFNYYFTDFQKYDNVKEHLYSYRMNMILSYCF